MIVVQGTVRVLAVDIERVRAVAAWFVPATRQEPGCLYYAMTQDMLDPTLVHVSERWMDEEAFQAHLSTPHAARLGEFMRKIHMADVTFTSYEAAGENLLMGGEGGQ